MRAGSNPAQILQGSRKILARGNDWCLQPAVGGLQAQGNWAEVMKLKSSGVLLGILTLCYTILVIVVFRQVGILQVLSSLGHCMQMTDQSTG